MTLEMEYQPPRDRDAVDAIRGFVYQIQVTIKRWLALSMGEILELEVGEDIDHLSSALAPDGRLLEQVKYFATRAITLRAGPVLEFLCNCFDHNRSNPGLRLRFLLTSNAAVGRERPSPLPKGISGIQYISSLGSQSTAADILPLRGLLLSGRQPKGVPLELWSSFRDYVKNASAPDLLGFFRSIAWSTRNDSLPMMEEAIGQTLRERLDTNSPERVAIAYQRLFVAVINAICGPAPRRLGHTALLAELDSQDISSNAMRLVERLTEVARIASKVTRLESQVAEHALLLETMIRGAPAASFELLTAGGELVPPPPLAICARRPIRIEEVSKLLDSAGWVAISGRSGVGKSQLAAMVATSFGEIRCWLRLRGKTEEQVSGVLPMVAFQLSSSSATSSSDWLERFASSIGSGVLVLDDMPRVTKASGLRERIAALSSEIAKRGGRTISTSVFEQYYLPSVDHESYRCPPFDKLEIEDLLTLAGAPASARSPEILELVNATCRGHATLVMACVRFLQGVEWHLDEKVVESIRGGEHAVGEVDETRLALLQSLPDPTARELLYRLLLTRGWVSLGICSVLAGVPPAISRPRECIVMAEGLWLQAETQDTWSLSPLLSLLEPDLLPETLAECHRRLANEIMKQSTLTPIQGIELSRHLVGCGEPMRAVATLGKLYLHILQDAGSNESGFYTRLVLSEPISALFPGPYAAFLRGLRFALARQCDRSGEDELQAAEALVSAVKPSDSDAISAVGACLTICLRLARIDPRRTTRFAFHAIRLWNPDTAGGQLSDASLSIGGLAWLGLTNQNSQEHRLEWFTSVATLTVEQRRLIESGTYAIVEALTVADAALVEQLDRPKVAQRWDEALRTVDEIADQAARLGLELLEACAIRTQLDILRTMDGGKPRLARELAASRTREFRDSRCRPLVLEKVAEAMLALNEFGEVPEVLAPVSTSDSRELPPGTRMRLRTYMARALERSRDFESALRYIGAAVEIGRCDSEIAEIEFIRSLALLSIAQWELGRAKESFNAASEATERLLRKFEPTEGFYKVLALILRHSFSFYANSLRGTAPDSTTSGQPYLRPSMEMLYNLPDEAASQYDDAVLPSLAATLALFADQVSDSEEVSSWADRAFALADGSKERSKVFVAFLTSIGDVMARRGLFEEMIEAAMAFDEVAAQLSGRPFGIAPPGFEYLSEQSQRERTLLLFALLSIWANVSRALVDDREAAASLAERAAVAVESYDFGVGGRWTRVGQFIRLCFATDGVRVESLVQAANAFPVENRELFVYLAHLAGGFVGSARLEQRLNSHFQAAFHLLPLLRNSAGADDTLAAAIDSSWCGVFGQRAFAFRQPAEIRHRMESSRHLPAIARMKATLSIMADGLGLLLDATVRSWLAEVRR